MGVTPAIYYTARTAGRGTIIGEPNFEESVLLDIERGLLQLHDRSSAWSNLADPLGVIEESVRLSSEAAAKVVATSAEIIEDVGEISRQNMLLVEKLVTSVRTLQQAHQAKVDVAKLPLHRRASPAQRLVLGIATVIGGALYRLSDRVRARISGGLRALHPGCVGASVCVRHDESGATAPPRLALTLPRAA